MTQSGNLNNVYESRKKSYTRLEQLLNLKQKPSSLEQS